LAQSWEGNVYQVDVGDKSLFFITSAITYQNREKNDSDFILFNQLPPDVKILTMGCTHQSTFTLTSIDKFLKELVIL